MTSGPTEPADVLLEAARRVTTAWLWRLVGEVTGGDQTDSDDANALADAVESIASAALTELDVLLQADVERQSSTPLSVFRAATGRLTGVLHELGYPASGRPRDAAQFPDDVYGLVPATWSDIDDSLTQPGLVWGAWKAATILERRR